MITKGLVGGLDTDSDLEIRERCENCIFRKHSTHPFNKTGTREKKVLKRVHIDIWGPARTQSAERALYFLIIMDEYFSFRTVAFLNNKLVKTTLRVFKTYHTETECQTGKQLKHVHLNMGKE